MIFSVGKSKSKNESVREDDFGAIPIITGDSLYYQGPITPFNEGATLAGTLDEMDEDQKKITQQLVRTQMMGERGRSAGPPHDV